MRIEAFTEGKTFATPDTNEDALLVLPGRAFAVLDGVTDRVGTRYDGVLAGRYAAQLLQRTLESLLSAPDAPLDDPFAVLDAATAALHRAYVAHGTAEAARTDFNRQMAAALALVTFDGDTAHVLLVGDSGVRLNGTTLWQEHKDLDLVTALLRRHAWALATTRTDDPAERERVSRAACWAGVDAAPALTAPLLDADDLRRVADAALAECRTHLPHVPEPALAGMIRGGIIHAQGTHANNPASPLGYPLLNGFPVPRAMVRHERVPRAGLRTIELFSDGYFAPGEHWGVASWEARFRAVEAEDPHKTGQYLSVKGTTATAWADDRTYLGVEL